MTALRARTGLPLFALLAAAVYATGVAVVRAGLPAAESPDVLAAAVAFDLVVGVPALFYLLCVRGRAGPARVVPVFLLSLVGASLVLPAAYDGVPAAIRVLAVAAEVALVAVLVSRAVRTLRAAGGAGDLADAVRDAVRPLVPVRRLADVAACEAALLAYALAGWRMRAPADEAAFSVHRRCGYGGVAFALGVAGAVELAVVHLLVHGWSPTAAWVLTALSAYGMVWLLGDAQAVRLRPVRADADALRVRVGLRWSVDVPWDDVAAISRVGRGPLAAARETLRAVPIGEPRLVLHLARPATATGPYGLIRRVTRIALAVDDEARFLAAVAERTGLTLAA